MIKYIEKLTVPCYDTDASWFLKPSSFMNYAQEAAGRHAVYLGFGYDDLIVADSAWILSRMHVVFVDAPRWRDDVTLTTWHKGLDRLFYLRDFLVTDSEGKERVKATTSWLVLDLNSRKLVRDPKLMEEGTVCNENVLDKAADKVRIPKDAERELAMEHVVSYSDVDMNGHTNNAMYMQWAMDAVPRELTSQKPVKEFTINFNHETKAGELVKVYRTSVVSDDGHHVFVEGIVNEVSAFCVEIVF